MSQRILLSGEIAVEVLELIGLLLFLLAEADGSRAACSSVICCAGDDPRREPGGWISMTPERIC